MRKKILFIVSNMKIGGGAERSVSYLCTGLKKHYDVELLTFYNDKKEYSVNVKRHSFNDKNKSNLLIKFYRFFVKYPLKLRKFLKKNNYDLVVSNAQDANLVSQITKKIFYKNFKLWSVIRADIQNKVYDKLKSLNNESDKIITICKSLEDKYSKIFTQKKITTLYNALDFEEIQKKLREKIPLAEEKLYNKKTITMIGRFVPQKNYFFLIEVFKEILKERGDIKLLIFGTGAQKQKIKNKIKKEKLEHKIILMGVKKNIFPYLKKTNVFVLPSLYEGMPRALMEAL
ncbi:MAG: glycosyltransferase, partial [Nanoarchaeota archaeon]